MPLIDERAVRPSRGRRRARAGLAASGLGLTGAAVALDARPAAAHGAGGPHDLPMGTWQLGLVVGALVVGAFAIATIVWRAPLLARAAAGRRLPAGFAALHRALVWAGRLVVVGLFALMVAAAFWGSDSPAENITPVTFYVLFWVGVPFLCMLFGDIWGEIGPAALLARARPIGGQRPTGANDNDDNDGGFSDWPGLIGIIAFLWLELAYHASSSPRAIGLFLVAYAAYLVAGALRHGGAWVAHGDGFTVLFRAIGAMAPCFRGPDGGVRLRPPLSGLARLDVRPGTVAVLLVTIAGTAFDGIMRTTLWSDITGARTGWARTGIATVGLVWAIAMVGAVYVAATRVVARVRGQDDRLVADAYAPMLVPVVVGYAVAHYFSLMVFESQNFLVQLSDPLGRGWDLLGTATNRVDYLALGSRTLAWVEIVAIAVSHVGAVLVAHDRTVGDVRGPLVLRSQEALVAMLVVSAFTALVVLLSS